MAFRKYKLNWKVKAIAFNILDQIPAGEKIYYLLQRHVTKTIPRALKPTRETGAAQLSHAQKFLRHGVDLTQSHLFEFGGGWDLYSNILLYCMGVNRQYVVDVRRWAKAEAINQVIAHLQADPPEGAIRRPEKPIRASHLEEDLKNFYGIAYHAPADARGLPVADGTFDLIATTSTLEHIPEDILRSIVKECHRVLKPQGLMSHVIDYSDHYAHSDPNINEFNYLQFDKKTWQTFNPSIHFQNRMRSRFYSDLFTACGFEMVELIPWVGERESLQQVPLSGDFKTLSVDELLHLGGHFLLRRV